MKKIEVQWKEFNVDLEAIDAKLKTDYPEYVGNQAHNILELWFEDSVSDEDMQAAADYVNALEEDSDEATSYRSVSQIKDALEAMKAAIPAKTWASMSVAERGLLIGLIPTKAQLIEAELL